MPTIQLSGCAIMNDGKILLIRKKDNEFWELPGGRVNTKDDVEQIAVNITKEQIGSEPTVVQQFTILEYQKDSKNIEANIFECDVNPESEFIPGEDIDEVKWHQISGLNDINLGEDVKTMLEELNNI